MGSLFGRRVMQMPLQSFRMLGFGLPLGCISKDFAVQLVLIGRGFLQREGMLGCVVMIKLGLGFVAKQAGELGQGDGLFGCVNDCFDLCFKAHGLVGVLLSIPMLGIIALSMRRRRRNANAQEVDKAGRGCNCCCCNAGIAERQKCCQNTGER